MGTIDIQEKFIRQALRKNFKNPQAFLKFKKKFFSENRTEQPSNADLRELYEKMVAQGKIKRDEKMEKAMLSRAVRTRSGVAVVAVLTKPSGCPGKCIYCPTEKGMPKSYLSNEPAVMRAIMNNFDPYRQVQSRIKALELNGHSTDKIELIVMGGTFSYFPKNYQEKFIAECFRAANNYPQFSPFGKGGLNASGRSIQGDSKDNIRTSNPSQSPFSKGRGLKHEQKRNEGSKNRIVGLTLETRPDYIDEKEILNFRELGCTRVELGIQSIYDDVLKINKRGHGVDKIVKATKLLKDAGFKVNYHMMPGLLGSTPKKDYKMFSELFSNPNFQPDMLKIYPTVVIKNTPLYNLWKKNKYKALTDKVFENLVIRIKNEVIPPYTRIQRLVRDVPLPSIEAGPRISNLRQIIEEKSKCQCIRCREIRGQYVSIRNSKVRSPKVILDRIDYDASDGKEIFLQFVSPDNKKLYALLRLRIPSTLIPTLEKIDKGEFKKSKNTAELYDLLPTLKNAALIREVHTFGKLISISQKDKKYPQHIGLGKKLIKEAEKIAREEFGAEKIAVISGVGVRDYYRKLDYRLKDTYMVKKV
ncbi:MAG: tRNA uridine(34) 5-carboxymethylaminomethyl modification radical SAM/GNAT enzyme Elp3 [Candidatus Moranbacteria bacterium]|jgi:elongator complex protein 3|nr:tRNA uridine(34) 5-carboxymethylaminomethyl modification radical SAM/GNAT enzyme Elp3 [Candidatus Moranbacteria bacterium]MDD5652468.1 tRNA uridine(34) 5-carboxymethylaminomethyl modification radical SAM/GNAT enzyme Elp3 [Candidatus Moranbacteria bacterium]MDX9855829.1 tRNA uridine(34) 5-carboxymethylaminomethyl modification radical SAM/GNAT enzyme Elp3 [Candidatus Moranbacteria bacterium]